MSNSRFVSLLRSSPPRQKHTVPKLKQMSVTTKIVGRCFCNRRDCELEPDFEIWEATTRWQCNELYHNSYPPPINLNFQTQPKHTCTQIFLPTDRQAVLFLQTEIFTQLFGCCCHPTTTNHLLHFLPPSFLLPPRSLLASTKNLLSQKWKSLFKPRPTQDGLSPLLSYTVTQREEKQCTSLTLWHLRPLARNSQAAHRGGAIYERFLPTTAALILTRSDRLFSHKNSLCLCFSSDS